MRKTVAVIVILFIIGLLSFFLSTSHKTQNASILRKPSVTISVAKGSHMIITSTAFLNNTSIPAKYTCDGKSINPPLTFGDVPLTTKSLAMIMVDPDASTRTFDHWVVYNINPTSREILENSVPSGGVQGLNSFGYEKYTGPCPPDRQHRYVFTIYALDTKLDFNDSSKVTKKMILDKVQGHILDQAELIGLYNRPQKHH